MYDINYLFNGRRKLFLYNLGRFLWIEISSQIYLVLNILDTSIHI